MVSSSDSIVPSKDAGEATPREDLHRVQGRVQMGIILVMTMMILLGLAQLGLFHGLHESATKTIRDAFEWDGSGDF